MVWSHIGKERGAASDVKTGRRHSVLKEPHEGGQWPYRGHYRDEGILNTATDWG